MTADELLHLWQTDLAALSSARVADQWLELSLPLSTLTSKFVRVFVQVTTSGNLLLCDLCDLTQDTYEVGNTLTAFEAAIDLTQRRPEYANFFCQSGAVFSRLEQPEQLTSRLFDFGQLLQLVVNLAVLAQETGPVCDGALVVSRVPHRRR